VSTNVTNLFQAYHPIRFQVWYILSICAYPGGKVYLAFSYNVLILDTIMIVIQFMYKTRFLRSFPSYILVNMTSTFTHLTSLRYNTWRDVRMILRLLIGDGYLCRVVKVNSLIVWLRFTRLFTSSFPPSSFLHRSRTEYRCINQAGRVDRSNKNSRNGNGEEKREKNSKWKEFRGVKKNWRGKAEWNKSVRARAGTQI